MEGNKEKKEEGGEGMFKKIINSIKEDSRSGRWRIPLFLSILSGVVALAALIVAIIKLFLV